MCNVVLLLNSSRELDLYSLNRSFAGRFMSGDILTWDQKHCLQRYNNCVLSRLFLHKAGAM